MLTRSVLSLGEHRTLHRQVVDAVGMAIMRQDFVEDSPLPSEDALSTELSVSRSALREAMKALAAKGLVELRPRTGTRVLPRVNWNFLDPDVLRWQASTDQQDLIDNTMELRAIVEPAAAALACLRATEQEMADLRLEIDKMRLASERGDTDGFNKADASFHVRVIQMSHNPMLAATARPLQLGLNACFELSSAPPGALDSSIPLHLSLLKSITDRKPKAVQAAMEELLILARKNIKHTDARKALNRGE